MVLNINDNKIIKRFVTTIVAPVGKERLYEKYSPKINETTDTTAEATVTFLKELQRLIAVRGGKIIREDTSNAPIILIPITTVMAVSTARIVLKTETFTPVAFAKSSSKVIAKILL